MGTCGLVGQIGVYSGWVNDVATGVKAAITPFDWLGLILISFVLPAVLCWAFGLFLPQDPAGSRGGPHPLLGPV